MHMICLDRRIVGSANATRASGNANIVITYFKQSLYKISFISLYHTEVDVMLIYQKMGI